MSFFKKFLSFKKILSFMLLCIIAFLFGQYLGVIHHYFFPNDSVTVKETTAQTTNSQENWGLSFQKDGERPIGNATCEELEKYNTYYAEDTDKKVLYLTFDCGYDNGNTEKIMTSLKKHHAPATFFVVGTYIRDHGDLVKKMLENGFDVGNHTYSHPDMSTISTKESFETELYKVETDFEKLTGTKMSKYYRPPQGKYSTANLMMAKELGYHTFFWSLAYVDWNQDNQPSKEEAFDKLIGRVHPGAIVLLHCTSSTNAEILDELLTRWEALGYSFKSLDSLVK